MTGKGAQGKHKDVVKYVCESDSRKEHPLPSCHHDVLQHHLEGAIALALKDELLRANMTQGISVEEQQLDTILAKTRKATENIRKHLYASDRWDDSVKADLNAKDAQLEDLLERKKEYEDAHTTIEAIRSQVQNVGVNSPFGMDRVRQSIGQCGSVRYCRVALLSWLLPCQLHSVPW